MKFIAIGATGFIGRYVVSELAGAGHEVAVVHRGSTPLKLGVGVFEILAERSTLQERKDTLRAWSPDVALDMILSSAPQARATLETFRGIARRVVAVSSGDVYRAMAVLHGIDPGPVEPVPLTEDSPLRTTMPPYSKEALAAVRSTFSWVDEEYDKVQVEQAIRSDPDLPATILRLPMVYG